MAAFNYFKLFDRRQKLVYQAIIFCLIIFIFALIFRGNGEFISDDDWPEVISRKDANNLDYGELLIGSDRGYDEAVFALARSLEFGVNGFEQNFKASKYYYEKLTKSSIKNDAYEGLARLYARGNGVEKDKRKAFYYFEKSIPYSLEKIKSDKDLSVKEYVRSLIVFGADEYKPLDYVYYDAMSGNDFYQDSVLYDLFVLIITQYSSGRRDLYLYESEKESLMLVVDKWLKILLLNNNNKAILTGYLLPLVNDDFPFEKDLDRAKTIIDSMAANCNLNVYDEGLSGAASLMGEVYETDIKNYDLAYYWYYLADIFSQDKYEYFLNIEKHLSKSKIERAKKDAHGWLDKHCL